MIGPLHGVLASLLVYVLLCGVAVVTGYGLLRLFRLSTLPRGAVLLAPVAALAFWSLTLGIAAQFRLPNKIASPCVWVASAALMIAGLRARAWPGRGDRWLALLCASLPVVTMADYFRHGLSDHLGSIAPDGWSYIAAAQYLWEYPRGVAGGLAPLYEYASHLSETRHVSYGLLGFLSPLLEPGDTQAVAGLFQAWALFTLAAAVAFFGIAARLPTRVVVAVTGLSIVAGWTANLIWTNNFDNQLGLVYMPALAGVLGSGRSAAGAPRSSSADSRPARRTPTPNWPR